MLRSNRYSLLFFCTFLLSGTVVSSAYATVYTSNGNGKWENASTWTPAGGPPGPGDNVVVASGHTVTTNSNQKSVSSLTVRGGGTVEGESAGDDVNIKAWGDINNSGTIKTKDGTNPAGSSGNINLEGDDVTNTGTIATGNAQSGGLTGNDGGDSGSVTITGSSAGTVSNSGTITTGNAGNGGESSSGGKDAGEGGKSGDIGLKTGTGGNVNNSGTVKTGDGGNGGAAHSGAGNGGNAGDSGSVDIDSQDVVNSGTIQTGNGKSGGGALDTGKSGGNGSNSGGITITGGKEENDDKARVVDKHGGKTKTGDRGSEGLGGPGGTNGHRGKRGSIIILTNVELVMGPGSHLEGGYCSIDGGPGAIILVGLDPDSITCYEEGVSIISDGGIIDLHGNLPGFPVITSPMWDPIEDPEGDIIFMVNDPSQILLDPGVLLDDIVDPSPQTLIITDSEIPTLGQWGALTMLLALMGLGGRLRRRNS